MTRTTVASPLLALSEQASSMTAADLPPKARSAVDDAVRCSLLCIGLGALAEREMAPALVESSRGAPATGEVFSVMRAALFEGTLGGAADLDPLDLGPAHLALPATVAACLAAKSWGGDDGTVLDAAIAGMEVGARLRRSLTGVRPGVGFHSVSTFGLFAAAAAVARVLRLSPTAFANAIGIALTRAAGLSLNNASTRIGLTHFGWAAAHGLEAGWLAGEGVDASLDVKSAFDVLFAGSTVDFTILEPNRSHLLASAPIVFKHYPCNIYLNLIARALKDHAGTGIDSIKVVMPSIPHLDQPDPKDVRQARNSAQAVAAIAALYPATYRSYTKLFLDANAKEDWRDLISAVVVEQDATRATGLERAVIDIEASRGRDVVVSESHRMAELTPWSRAHAEQLIGDIGPDRWVAAVYDNGYLEAHDFVAGFLVSRDA
ncbi:MAG: MmgE/PrpD family protein [Candidatus Dormibacteraceae bacterium]